MLQWLSFRMFSSSKADLFLYNHDRMNNHNEDTLNLLPQSSFLTILHDSHSDVTSFNYDIKPRSKITSKNSSIT